MLLGFSMLACVHPSPPAPAPEPEPAARAPQELSDKVRAFCATIPDEPSGWQYPDDPGLVGVFHYDDLRAEVRYEPWNRWEVSINGEYPAVYGDRDTFCPDHLTFRIWKALEGSP